MSDLRDNFERAVEYLVEELSDASELKQLLVEAIKEDLVWKVDDAIYEGSDNPSEENALSSMSKHIVYEAVERLADTYKVTLTKKQ